MKNFKYIILTICMMLFYNNKVLAGASLSTSSSQIYRGESFTATVSVNAAAWNVHVSASGPVSGCSISEADSTSNAMNTSKTFSTTCTATGTGTITVSLSGDTTSESGDNSSISGSKTVQVVSKPVTNNTSNNTSTSKPTTNKTTTTKTETKKDSNNKLEEFGVASYSITPEYSNDVYDYKLTVSNDVKTIKIYASRNSAKSTVSGIGDKEVQIGENKFQVVVTAEDGSKRTLNLTVTVEDKPISIKVDNQDFNVVKKKEELPELNIDHEEMTLTIQEQEVPAYRIDNIGYILIGLRDSEGNINLYKFDSFKNDEQEPTYELFNYIESNGILLINKEIAKNKIPDNYKKYTETINDKEYIVYKLNKNSKYSLIYGLNIKTGKENIYKYDSKENTLQIYDREEQKQIEEKNEKYEKLILILAGVIVVLVLLTTIGFTKKQKIKEIENVDTDFLSKKDIKKIEKNTKKQEKKNKKKQKKDEE